MKTEEFQILAAELARLTPHQRRLLADCLHKIGHIQAVSTLIESNYSAYSFSQSFCNIKSGNFPVKSRESASEAETLFFLQVDR